MPTASCALRGGFRFLRKATDNATAPAGAAVIVCAIGQIPSLQPTLFFQPPAQTCHRQLCRRDGRAFCPSIFSFTKEKQKKENEVNERWQFIIWKRRRSAGAGRSAVAASAYLSCSRLYNDYDGIQHDCTKKQGLLWQQVFLPEYALQEWQDREKLWNAVEEVETAKDSRLARGICGCLPIELNRKEQVELLQEFIREQFVSDGMCADAAIHDTDGRNPSCPLILLTVRPLDEQGHWQYKTEKEYLCMRNGEERGFSLPLSLRRHRTSDGRNNIPAARSAKEGVYGSFRGRCAQGLPVQISTPKSTRYGRQNPISERWNSEGAACGMAGGMGRCVQPLSGTRRARGTH